MLHFRTFSSPPPLHLFTHMSHMCKCQHIYKKKQEVPYRGIMLYLAFCVPLNVLMRECYHIIKNFEDRISYNDCIVLHHTGSLICTVQSFAVFQCSV